MSASRSNGLWVGVAAAALVVAVGGYHAFRSDGGAAPQAPAAREAAGLTTDEAAETKAPVEKPPVEAATESLTSQVAAPPTREAQTTENADAPRLDVVRVEADGAALLAGQAAPREEVSVRLDGQEVGTATADANGNFVAMLDLPVSDAPQLLTVMAPESDAAPTETILIAPAARDPANPADASPAPEAAPEGVAVAPVDAPDPGAIGTAPALDIAAEPRPSEAQPAPTLTVPARDKAALPAQEEPGRPDIVAPPAALDARNDASAPPQIETAEARAPDATAPAAPRIFRTGPEGLRLETAPGPGPEVTQSLGLDAIAYGADGEVQLTGRGDSETELRVYLDGRPVQSVAVGEGGTWASPLPNVDEGVYTLRIDAVAADGSVVSRIETPFKRTAPEIAAAAREAGASVLTVQPGFTLWAISQGYFGDGLQYVQIFEANRSLIRDPDLIYPGQVLTLPDGAAADEG